MHMDVYLRYQIQNSIIIFFYLYIYIYKNWWWVGAVEAKNLIVLGLPNKSLGSQKVPGFRKGPGGLK